MKGGCLVCVTTFLCVCGAGETLDKLHKLPHDSRASEVCAGFRTNLQEPTTSTRGDFDLEGSRVRENESDQSQGKINKKNKKPLYN